VALCEPAAMTTVAEARTGIRERSDTTTAVTSSVPNIWTEVLATNELSSYGP
jgi:hypothetical protein